MKTQTHTPGPWKLSAETMLSSASKRVVTVDNKFVLRIEGADFGRDEDRANARLIASAPDLISALERAESALSFFINDEGECDVEALDEARAAIAKATGKQ